MAWIRKRKRLDSGITYTVTWREPGDQKESTLAFKDDPGKAEETVRLLDANGQSLDAANAVLASAKLDGPTLYEMLELHIDQLVGVGDYQLGRYRSARNQYFRLGLGSMRVKGIQYKDVNRWVQGMQRAGLSPKTISNHHGLLSAAFTTAVRDRIIDHNPCTGIRLPKAEHAKDDAQPTAADWLLIRAALDAYFVPFFDFLVGTGLRFGEATALRASDFRLDGAVPMVDVRRAWKQNSDGTYYLGVPKTVKATRTVSLAPSTVAAVLPALESAGDGLVFRLKRGGPMRSPAVHGRVWQPAIKKARTLDKKDPDRVLLDKHVTIHQLRHLHAALMLQGGMPIYDLSRRMGHTSIQMTIDRYSHLLPDAHFTGAAVATKALEGL
jgi:integrase